MKRFIVFLLVFFYLVDSNAEPKDKKMIAIFDANEEKIDQNQKLTCSKASLEVSSRSAFVSSSFGHYLFKLKSEGKLNDAEIENLTKFAFRGMNASAYVGCSQGQKNSWGLTNHRKEYLDYLEVVDSRYAGLLELLRDQSQIKNAVIPSN